MVPGGDPRDGVFCRFSTLFETESASSPILHSSDAQSSRLLIGGSQVRVLLGELGSGVVVCREIRFQH